MYSIYQLVDPRDHAPRYIGLSANVQARLEQHLQRDGSNLEKDQWIAELARQGLAPILEVLEVCKSREGAIFQEAAWIRTRETQGAELLNRSASSEDQAWFFP
jgi:predicted GIY-YIG superfamily endonuclease